MKTITVILKKKIKEKHVTAYQKNYDLKMNDTPTKEGTKHEVWAKTGKRPFVNDVKHKLYDIILAGPCAHE